MQTRGCDCKGSVAIHKECLQQWMETADNPFKCSVCKTDFSGSFLKNFMTEEDILLHPMGKEEEEEEPVTSYYEYHGMVILESEDSLIFECEEHKSIYFRSLEREDQDTKMESIRRQKNALRFQVKAYRPPSLRRRSKSIPFRK